MCLQYEHHDAKPPPACLNTQGGSYHWYDPELGWHGGGRRRWMGAPVGDVAPNTHAPTPLTRWAHQNTCTGPLTDRDRGVPKWPHWGVVPLVRPDYGGGFQGRPPPLARPHGNPVH